MGAVAEILDQMRAQRAGVQEFLAGVAEDKMLAPTTYGQREVNLRFMFYRLVAHELEHTVQMVKALNGIGRFQSEAQLILGRLQAARGELEALLIGLTDEELDQAPSDGEWSPRQVLEHIIEVEDAYTKRMTDALSAPGTTA